MLEGKIYNDFRKIRKFDFLNLEKMEILNIMILIKSRKIAKFNF